VRIAEKHVSDLVVEVELQTETPPTIALPQELIDLLSAKLSPDVLHAPDQYAAVGQHCYCTFQPSLMLSLSSQASTYLLAWLVAFRFFETAVSRPRRSTPA